MVPEIGSNGRPWRPLCLAIVGFGNPQYVFTYMEGKSFTNFIHQKLGYNHTSQEGLR